jgi:hypothetical protein
MKVILISTILIIAISCSHSSTNKKEEKTQTKDTVKIINDSTSVYVSEIEQKGFDLMDTETIGDLKLSLKIEDLKRILGEASKKSTIEIWEADGEYHQSYEYTDKGIEIGLYGEKDIDKTVDMINIQAPCNLKTSKGIKLGDSYKLVEAAYIEYINPQFTDSTTITVGSIYGGIIFNFKENSLNSIFIGAAAE